MRTIGYNGDRLFGQSIGLMMLCAGGVWMAMHDDFGFKVRAMGVVFIGIGLVLPIGMLKRWLYGDVAMRFDERGLEINTLFSSAYLPWGRITDIDIEELTQEAFFGLYKKTVARHLVVQAYDDGGALRKYKISSDLLALPKRGGVDDLVDELEAVRADPQVLAQTMPLSPMGRAMPPKYHTPPQAGPQAGASVQPPVPGFAGQRPSFGRKAV